MPRHARRYAHTREAIDAAVRGWAADVAAGTVPGEAESTRMDDAVLAEALGLGQLDRPADEPAPKGVSSKTARPSVGIPLDRDL